METIIFNFLAALFLFSILAIFKPRVSLVLSGIVILISTIIYGCFSMIPITNYGQAFMLVLLIGVILGAIIVYSVALFASLLNKESASKLGVVTMVSPDGRYQVLGVVMMVSPDGRYQVQVNNKIWDAVSSDKLAVEDKIEVISFTFNWGKELLTVRKKNNENSIICKACGTVVPNGYLYCPKCDKELNK